MSCYIRAGRSVAQQSETRAKTTQLRQIRDGADASQRANLARGVSVPGQGSAHQSQPRTRVTRTSYSRYRFQTKLAPSSPTVTSCLSSGLNTRSLIAPMLDDLRDRVNPHHYQRAQHLLRPARGHDAPLCDTAATSPRPYYLKRGGRTQVVRVPQVPPAIVFLDQQKTPASVSGQCHRYRPSGVRRHALSSSSQHKKLRSLEQLRACMSSGIVSPVTLARVPLGGN